MTTQQTRLQLDEDHRARAINPRGSFIVEAPAGAGKTELLTQRFLALLAQVADPEEIVALTFTNKAAAEMRHRVTSSLVAAERATPPLLPHKRVTYDLGREVLERDAALGWGLLKNPGRLQITTLDALCGKLARQMPLLSRMGTQLQVCTDANLYLEQAAKATLEEVESGSEPGEAITRVLEYFENDGARLQALLVDMLSRRDQWLRHARTELDQRSAEHALSTLITQALSDVLDALPPGWQTDLMPAARFAASHVAVAKAAGEALAPELDEVALLADWAEPLVADVQLLPLWRALAQLVLTKKGEVRSALPKAWGFSTPEGKPLGPVIKGCLERCKLGPTALKLAQVRTLPPHSYGPQERGLIQDLVTVLKVAVAHLWLGFKQGGEVDFTTVAQAALEALGPTENPTDLALRMDYRLSHLLVDEFQDTSPTQVDLLKRLTAGWTGQDGRTLFVVGDPMQSIYKFRKADVGLFLKVQEQGLGDLRLTRLPLYRNNRSSANVVQWVNTVFPNVFAPRSNIHRGAVCFSEAQATQPHHPQSQVAWHPVIDAHAGDEDDNPQTTVGEREAAEVVRCVLAAQLADPNGRVAILVRARTHLVALVQLLRTAYPQLRYQAIEIEGLASRQVVQDLLSLTCALLHRGDRTHWLATLRAPWCGLLLQDLHQLAADDHQRCIWDLMQDDARIARMTPDGQQRITRLRAVLAHGLAQQGRLRTRRWLEGVWHALGGPHTLSGPSDLIDARAFFDVVDRLDAVGGLDIHRLQLEVDKLFAAPDPEAGEALQIMTIHKSKGLEFDTVILPGLHRKAPPADRPLLVWDEALGDDQQERLVVASLPSGPDAEQDGPTKYQFLHQFEQERTRNETQRLLYVAVTRAKRNLHLVACAQPDTDAEHGVKAPIKDSLLSLLWHDAAPHFADAAQAQARPSAVAPPPVQDPVRVPLSAYNHQLVRLAVFPPLALPVAAGPEPSTEPTREPGGRTAPEDRLAADLGTLVHKYLQLIAEDGLAQWSPDRVQQLQGTMARWMVSRGHAVAAAAAASREAVVHLLNTLASEQGRWLLGPHDAAACEQAYTTITNGVVNTHVIDRTFKVDGVRWIVDYKTTAHVKTDFADLNDSMQAQLQRYAGLFGADTPIRLMVFFTASGLGVSS